jgi:serine O-acetyltransferase
MPTIGAGAYIAAGATLIGKIEIGDNVFVGAHALVARDVPDDSRVLSEAGLSISLRRSDSS